MTQLQEERLFQLKNPYRLNIQMKTKSIKLLRQLVFPNHPLIRKLTANNYHQKMKLNTVSKLSKEL